MSNRQEIAKRLKDRRLRVLSKEYISLFSKYLSEGEIYLLELIDLKINESELDVADLKINLLMEKRQDILAPVLHSMTEQELRKVELIVLALGIYVIDGDGSKMDYLIDLFSLDVQPECSVQFGTPDGASVKYH